MHAQTECVVLMETWVTSRPTCSREVVNATCSRHDSRHIPGWNHVHHHETISWRWRRKPHSSLITSSLTWKHRATLFSILYYCCSMTKPASSVISSKQWGRYYWSGGSTGIHFPGHLVFGSASIIGVLQTHLFSWRRDMHGDYTSTVVLKGGWNYGNIGCRHRRDRCDGPTRWHCRHQLLHLSRSRSRAKRRPSRLPWTSMERAHDELLQAATAFDQFSRDRLPKTFESLTASVE